MTTPSSPVEVLRAAADRLDELAAKATPNICPGWIHRAVRHIARNVDIECLHDEDEPDPDTDGRDHDGWSRYDDWPWVAAMGPQVAPALSAWLRAEADTAQASDQTRASFRPTWRDDWSPEDPPPDWSEANRVAALEAMHRHPLAFARMVLGLPAVSDTTGEGHRG